MLRSLYLAIPLVLSPALFGCGSSATTVAEARALADNAETTVEGTVTVAPGVLESSSGDKGFALQDATGGIYVVLTSTVDLAVGKKVQVTGTLESVNMLRAIKADPAKVEAMDGAEAITPKVVKTSEVGTATEGLLVQTSGTISKPVADDMPYGFKVYINDGSGEIKVFLNTSAGFDAATVSDYAMGTTIKVTGFSSRYNTDFEVDPRSSADITAGP
jgi:uncharacterized protein YdeI (BOF family)